MGIMTALALAAGAGLGNAVEVLTPGRPDVPRSSSGPRRIKPRRKRLNVRVSGGNWQGLPYLSYAEHDRCVRATLGLQTRGDRDLAYRAELERITAGR
jgi:hypothetical protein